MPYPGTGTMPSPNMAGLSSSRTIVRHGIAQYFGGTWVPDIRAYQGGPLLSSGLVTVKAGYGKRIDWRTMFNQLSPGRGMGTFMVVTLNRTGETRNRNTGAFAGRPVLDGSNNIIAGGIKLITYQCVLQCFHLAQENYAEDAQDDIDAMIEAIKQAVRMDRTLGQLCTDAGETSFGLRDTMDDPIIYGERTATHFTVQFEVRVQIVA